jgi:hypothetical protein
MSKVISMPRSAPTRKCWRTRRCVPALMRGRRGLQFFKLHMDREAFSPDLGDDRPAPRFFWQLRKRQRLVLAVLHRTSHGSRPRAKASLCTARKSLLLNGRRFPTLAVHHSGSIGFVWDPNERGSQQLTPRRRRWPTKTPFLVSSRQSSNQIYEFRLGTQTTRATR